MRRGGNRSPFFLLGTPQFLLVFTFFFFCLGKFDTEKKNGEREESVFCLRGTMRRCRVVTPSCAFVLVYSVRLIFINKTRR